MDFVFYSGNDVIECVEPFLTAMTGAKGLVFGLCQQPNDVLSLVLHPMFERSN
jgi:hypothetical protein